MAIPVKTICSECATLHITKLQVDQATIQCPSCGHSLQNLPKEELTELERITKSQRISVIIALISFVIGTGCFFAWIMNQQPTFMKQSDDFMQQTGLPALTILTILLTLVFGILGSRKRFVIEY